MHMFDARSETASECAGEVLVTTNEFLSRGRGKVIQYGDLHARKEGRVNGGRCICQNHDFANRRFGSSEHL